MHPTPLRIALGLWFAFHAAAMADDDIWTRIDSVPAHVRDLPEVVRPLRGQALRVDLPALRARLAAAPAEFDPHPPLHLSLPLPDGSFQTFALRESPILEPGLAAAAPDIRTYAGYGVDDPAAAIRLDLTRHGVHAMVRGPSDVFLIDPYSGGDTAHVTSYRLRDCRQPNEAWQCLAPPDGPHAPLTETGFANRGGTTLRTYRFAVACTGEYGEFHSQRAGNAPNADDPLAAVVTVVNRSNLVFEADLGVRFVLVANNRDLMFFDPATDPYDGTSSSACLSVNRTVVNNAIGSANYDIGHVITRIPGGVANLRVACTSNKARGVSGIPRGGDADPLTALVVIHELGHQFGAGHTFNGSVDRCLSNIMPASAWEPGSGSTQMAYAGGCPVGLFPAGDNLQLFADPFFHHGNIGEMAAFINPPGGGASCPQTTASGNAAPQFVSLPPDTIAIPPGTPFTLACLAEDPDNDPVAYSWEQFDLGPQQPLLGEGSDDNGQSPLFRVYTPSLDPSRTIPPMTAILSGTSVLGDRLPTFAPASRKMRVVARDGRIGGVTISPTITLEITPSDPFALTFPFEGVRLTPGAATILWNAGTTAQPPINAPNVRLLLSLDDGVSFPITLASSAPNTGQAQISLPPETSATARIRIEPTNSIFFCLSPRFEIQPCLSDFNASGGTPDDADVTAFFQAWNDALPAADVNASGGTPDDADVSLFFDLWNTGC
ncbi:MAG: hypothetical protein IPM33_05965 [Phycisphaerales bacterium]|nr:hypothetical protein [Phycisphaerales bacterium]